MVAIYGSRGEYIRSPQYSGEKIPGELNSWKYYTAHPAALVSTTYGRITDMCASLYATTELGGAAVEKQLDYIIGPGLKFKSQIKEGYLGLTPAAARKWSAEYEDLLELHKAAIGYDSKIRQLAIDALITGDSILYFDDSSGAPDMYVEGGHAIQSDKADIANRVLMGVEVNGRGNPIAFFKGTYPDQRIAMTDEAGQMQALLFSFPRRAGQPRGYSVLFRSIARIKGIDRWWDATINRAVMEAIQIGYSTTSETDISGQARRMANAALGKQEVDQETKKAGIPMVPGMYDLRNRESLKFTELQTPSNNFAAGNEETRNMVAMGVGVPPEVLVGRYGSSYSASKNALNDFSRRMAVMRRAITELDTIVNKRYLQYFVRSGYIKIKKPLSDPLALTAYTQGAWQGPQIGHVNPLQSVKALREAVDGGFLLPSQAAAEYGNDLDDMTDQYIYEMQRLAEAEINDEDKA